MKMEINKNFTDKDLLEKLYQKERYEYCNNSIFDNEENHYVEDVIERLNIQDFKKHALLKIKQKQDEEIFILEKAFELACKEELRNIGIYDDDLDYKKELLLLKNQYKEEAKLELAL